LDSGHEEWGRKEVLKVGREGKKGGGKKKEKGEDYRLREGKKCPTRGA